MKQLLGAVSTVVLTGLFNSAVYAATLSPETSTLSLTGEATFDEVEPLSKDNTHADPFADTFSPPQEDDDDNGLTFEPFNAFSEHDD